MVYEVEKGESIINAARKSISALWLTNKTEGVVVFNDIEIKFYRNSNPNDIVEKYYLLSEVRGLQK